MPERIKYTVSDFRQMLRDGGDPGDNAEVTMAAVETEVSAGAEDRQVQFTISSAAVDRMGDTIAVDGWKLDNFNKNPVVLWMHCPKDNIGIADRVWVEGGKLKAIADFMPAGMSPLADSIYNMLTHPKRFLRATSVGFIPVRYAFTDEPGRGFGIDFMEQELTEFSVVSIPANPEALMDAKSAGINTRPVIDWIERVLDGEGMSVLPRKQLEAMRGLPKHFRVLAEQLPDKAKGARGQLIRCANIAARQMGAAEEIPAEEAPAPTPAIVPVPKPRLAMAQRKVGLLRARIG